MLLAASPFLSRPVPGVVMRGHISVGITAAICIAAVSVCGVKLFAEDPKPAMKPDEAAMMAAWQKYATPGPEHAELAKMVGDWDAVIEDQSAGGMPKSTGTAHMTMIMGGRYLQEEIKATMMGQPFEGLATTAFDNQTKEYISTWIDSMGTGLAVSKGKVVGGKKEMSGEMIMPGMEKPCISKSSFTAVDNDHFVMDMTTTTADGAQIGAMKITYTRKK
jgi:hypothetical protein